MRVFQSQFPSFLLLDEIDGKNGKGTSLFLNRGTVNPSISLISIVLTLLTRTTVTHCYHHTDCRGQTRSVIRINLPHVFLANIKVFPLLLVFVIFNVAGRFQYFNTTTHQHQPPSLSGSGFPGYRSAVPEGLSLKTYILAAERSFFENSSKLRASSQRTPTS